MTRVHAARLCLLLAGPCLLLPGLLGCPAKKAPPAAGGAPEKPTGPLTLLVVGSERLADVLEREWRAGTNGDLQVQRRTETEFNEWLSKDTRDLGADVVVFPPYQMGELANRRLIRPLPTRLLEEAGYGQLDIYPQTRQREMMWNGQPHAVSFGDATLVLLSRPDLVPQPPATWRELAEEVARLRETLPADVLPLAEPLTSSWRSRQLHARAATYYYDSSRVSTLFDYHSMKPRIGLPPVVRGLEELARSASPACWDLDPPAVLQAFLDGKAALAITWPGALAAEGDLEPVPFPVAIAPLPGARDRYDAGASAWVTGDDIRRVTPTGLAGHLGAITRTASDMDAATRLLGWATSPQQGARIGGASVSSGPVRKSQGEAPEAWCHRALPAATAKEFTQIVEVVRDQPATVGYLRVPGRAQYEAALDATIAEVRAGAAADEALARCARNWEQISASRGQEKQLQSYQQSLGLKLR